MFQWKYSRLVLAGLVLGPVAASPAAGQVEGASPLQLSSGNVAQLTRADVAFLRQSEAPVIGLLYRSDFDLPEDGGDADAVEKRLDGDTQEICERYAQPAIDGLLAQYPDVPFKTVGIVLQKVTGRQNDTELTVNWTGVFYLTDGKCGDRIEP